MRAIYIPPILSSLRDCPQLLEYGKVSFSICAEDIEVTTLLRNETEKGVFVDFGAYHPVEFSNTFLLYLNGWRGMNVDANPQNMELFWQLRPEDLSLTALVGGHEVEEFTYYHFVEPAVNGIQYPGFNPEVFNQTAPPKLQVVHQEKRTTIPVNILLEEFVREKKFDFLSIDCEAMDTRIITAMDFKRFRPRVISVEITLQEFQSEPLASFLKDINYEIHAVMSHSTILLRKDG